MVASEKNYRSSVPLCELNQEEYPAEHCLTTTTTAAARQAVGVPAPPPSSKTDQQIASNANARKRSKLEKEYAQIGVRIQPGWY